MFMYNSEGPDRELFPSMSWIKILLDVSTSPIVLHMVNVPEKSLGLP